MIKAEGIILKQAQKDTRIYYILNTKPQGFVDTRIHTFLCLTQTQHEIFKNYFNTTTYY